MTRQTDVGNAIAALRAAGDALECGNSSSALEYIAVAVAEVSLVGIAPGHALLYQTDDSARCAELHVIDRDGWETR